MISPAELAQSTAHKGIPITFHPAITSTPPQSVPEGTDITQQLIRPRAIEVVSRLTQTSYMVTYVILQESYVLLTCYWGDIPDPIPLSITLPGDPYLSLIAFEHQPLQWYLSLKLTSKDIDDFSRWALYGVTTDPTCTAALTQLRNANLTLLNEINATDPQSTK